MRVRRRHVWGDRCRPARGVRGTDTEERARRHRLEEMCAALLEKKASDVTDIDVATRSSVADRFVIASGGSRIAVQALADAVRERLATWGERPLRTEGYAEGRWVCLDCGDVVIHLFQHEVRRYFDLERLWGDAPQRSWESEALAASV